jgi:hypothetical protein
VDAVERASSGKVCWWMRWLGHGGGFIVAVMGVMNR